MEPLIIDRPELIHEKFRRIITCDPAIYFQRAAQHPLFSNYKRRNYVESEQIFPQPDKTVCSCGCGKKLTGRRRRWATDECQQFAYYICQIIIGDSQVIRLVMRQLYEEQCFICARTDKDFNTTHEFPEFNRTDDIDKWDKQYNRYVNQFATKIHLDHIIPVHQGGGSLWLDNYQFLCIDCHKTKSRNERKFSA